MKALKVAVAVVAAIIIGIVLFSQEGGVALRSGEVIPHKQWNAAIEHCIERGKAYYTAIGTFPRLSDGRDTVSVVREYCNRSPLTAF